MTARTPAGGRPVAKAWFPRSAARSAYTALPFKRHVFGLLRRLWTPPRALTEHLFFEGPFDVAIDGARIQLTNHNSPHETALFWHGFAGWPERASIRYWMALCRNASTIADVGANVGIYSVVAKAVNPSATVLAFEPVPRFFRRLVANCERNRLDVRCFECALSDREGEAALWDLPADHHYHASLSLDAVRSQPGLVERTVRTRTMAGVLAGEGLERLDLVKIDVEGWEPAVLEGMGPLLAHRPTILVEIKDPGRAREIERLLEGRGYLFYDLDEEGSPSRRTRLGPSRKWNWLICQPPVARALGLD